MFNLNRITLIGNTGANAKTTPNGPTTLSLASNVSWTDNTTGERRTRTEWHSFEVLTKVAKIKVQRMIRLESAGNTEGSDLAGDAQ